MPYRRRRRMRRKRRGRRRGKGKVSVPRTMVAYDGIKNFKLRLTQEVATDPTTGELSFYIQPSNLSSFLNVSGSSGVGLSEVGSITALFDQYRVSGVRLQWIPKYSQFSQTTSQVSATGDQITFGAFPAVGMVYDKDQTGNITYPNLITRDRFMLVDPTKKWSRYFKISRSIQGQNAQPVILPNGWMNCQTISDHTGQTIVVRSDGPFQSNSNTSDPNLVNFTLGTLVATCYLQVKHRQ